ncbi:MAG: SidA/IucD/PvdA family monooxygenase [Ktedonobacteraceae bacterium]
MAEALFSEHSQPEQTLLILGAGPKAVAIAAKRAILAQLGIPGPCVVAVDYQGVAAHWSGTSGFTDGRQLLGTRPEKDVGFPYASTSWGDDKINNAVSKKMLLLSWHSYLVSNDKYSDWIDRGRTRPTHKEWSSYIRWVAEKIDLNLYTARVQQIAVSSDHRGWELLCMPVPVEGKTAFTLVGAGLVITGPGTPLTIPGQPLNHPRVMDGNSFWTRIDELARLRTTVARPLNIGVIGTGETAAAIVVALLDMLRSSAFIEVITPNGVLYSRDEGFEENQMFSDPDGRWASLHGDHRHAASWLRLSEEARREFIRRTDRGVFSLHAMQEINQAENVRSVLGIARSMQVSDTDVSVDVEYVGNTERDTYDYVIVARGFDALWFTSLFDTQTCTLLKNATNAFDTRAIERSIGEDLSIRNLRPCLHLPMLAGVSQGPGFPNLSCLGLLSDRILSSYNTPTSH